VEVCGQGFESVLVELHAGKATRVSVAVIEGKGGPVAFIPSQEQFTCPEADFMDALIDAERRRAQLEVDLVTASGIALQRQCRTKSSADDFHG
jgi:hypothetical protein